jgi:hypothetical protein
MLIIVPSPRIDLLFGIVNRLEPMSAQTFLAELPIEGFYDCVVGWLATAVEVDLNLIRVRLMVHVTACELRSVITGDSPWQAALVSNLPRGCHHVFSSQTEADFDRRALARE